MPNAEKIFLSPGHLIALAIVFFLITESVRAWIQLLRARQSGQPWFDWNNEPRAAWASFSEMTALFLVFLMLAMKCFPSPEAAEHETMTFEQLMMNVALSSGIAFLLPAILISSHSASEYGIRFQSLIAQARDGVRGFLLAFAPTAILMLATVAFRNRENQNSLLTLLSDSPDPFTVIGIIVMAVVLAPLYEEMMFRVILQGWMLTQLKPTVAIPVTAIIFAAVHGPVDGVALVPLACILGYVYYRGHSYISVLVIHGLFNATMLVLAMLQ